MKNGKVEILVNDQGTLCRLPLLLRHLACSTMY